MNNRVVKVLALLVVLILALGVGVVAGGGLVYALTRLGGGSPIVRAQTTDPGYGIVIASLLEDGPAEKAGVARSDILLEIDGQELEGPSDLRRILDDLEPSDEVELTVLHGDELRTLSVVLGERDGRPYLGLNLCGSVPEAVPVSRAASGALLTEVVSDSPAEEAGLQVGDVIVAVDGQAIDVEHSLADLIAGYKPGDRVMLEVMRPGEESREVTAKLGEHPDDEEKAYLGIQYVPSAPVRVFERGISAPGEFDFAFPFVFPEGEIEQGAIVRHVEEDSPALAAGLEEGNVITAIDGELVDGPRALAEALADRMPGDEITLTIYRPDDEEELDIEVRLGEHPDDEDRAYLGVSLGGFFHIRRFGGDEIPPDFKFFRLPHLDWEELPLPWESAPPRFRFDWHWLPEGDCGWPVCFGDSI